MKIKLGDLKDGALFRWAGVLFRRVEADGVDCVRVTYLEDDAAKDPPRFVSGDAGLFHEDTVISTHDAVDWWELWHTLAESFATRCGRAYARGHLTVADTFAVKYKAALARRFEAGERDRQRGAA